MTPTGPEAGAAFDLDHDRPIVAVTAHGLLSHIAVVRVAAATLEERGLDLDPTERDQLFAIIRRQTAFLTAVLEELAEGLPDGARQALNELQRPTKRD